MIDRPEHIFKFLPMKYQTVSETEFEQFWWNAYLKNFQSGDYHVSFLAFHMLYMMAVYYLLFQISKVYPISYKTTLFHMGNDEEDHYLQLTSALSFVKMNEKAVFRFLKIAGADRNLIGEVSKFIEQRNDATHAKGVIFFKNDPEALTKRAVEYVQALEKIQSLILKELDKVSDEWRVSRLTLQELGLFLESEIQNHSLTPAELESIAKKESEKRSKLSAALILLKTGYLSNFGYD